MKGTKPRRLEAMLKANQEYSYEGLVHLTQQYVPHMDAGCSHWVHEMFNEALQQEMSIMLQPARGPGARLTPWGHYQARDWAPTPGHYTLVETHITDNYLGETPQKVRMHHQFSRRTNMGSPRNCTWWIIITRWAFNCRSR